MKKTTLISALVAFVLLTAPVRAAQPQRGGTPENRPPGPGEVLQMLDAYALVQAQTALQLRESQRDEFMARLRQLQQTRRRAQQARNGILQELRRLTAPGRAEVDEAAVRQRLEALREHEQRTAADTARAYQALDEILDIRQQARFRVFEENLERRKLDLLMRARRGAGGRGQ